MPLAQVQYLGRLGNLLFQHAFYRAWCEQNNFSLCSPPWIGEQIFSGVLEAVRPDRYKPDKVFPEHYRQHQDDLIYTRKQVKEWFGLKPEILEKLSPIKIETILFNRRSGKDYRDAGMVIVSEKSYYEGWKNHFPLDAALSQPGSEKCIPWESDTNPTLLPEFAGNIEASGLGVTAVALPSFYRIMKARVLFRSNSTFAWWASTLSANQITLSPVIDGLPGGDQDCVFVKSNAPRMTNDPNNSDLHLPE